MKKIAFDWVKKVIDSCSTSEHLSGATKLIHLFGDRFNDYSMTNELFDHFIEHSHNLILEFKINC